MDKRKRAAIYARYSSDNQRNESIDAQIRAIEEFCKSKGYEVIKIYVDRAKTATSDKRPEFQKMIKESELGIFDVVIVHKLDRFSRNKYDSATYKRKLKVNGVRVVSVTENLDGSPESVILESVIEGMAEYYSKNLAREVMKGLKETAYQCKHTGGIPPLGYDVNSEKKYVINEAEAEIVSEIYDKYSNGYGYGQIIDYLNNRGYKTKVGNTFSKNSLYSILSNEKYSGVYVFNRTAKKDEFGKRNSHLYKDEKDVIRIDGGMPAIVTKEKFQEVKKMMEARKKAPGANKAKEVYLLQGIIRCGHCGGSMNGNRRKPKDKPKYVSYRCSCREQKRTCDNREIRREYIEEFVLSELEKHILNDRAIPLLVEKINLHLMEQSARGRGTTDRMIKELEDVNKQMENIITAISNGFFHDEFKSKMDNLKDRKTQLEINIKEEERKNDIPNITEDQVKKLFSSVKDFVKERNIPECKKFIQNYVDSVIVYKDRVEVIFNVVFSVLGNIEGLKIKSVINKRALIERYSNGFYIMVSV